MEIIDNIFMFIVAALIVYFLFPSFLGLVADFLDTSREVVSDIKTAFKDKAKEWEDILSLFVGGDKK